MGETSTKGGRWPTPGEALIAVVAALVILALGLGGAQRSRELTLERREVEDREVLADVAVGVALDLERALAVMAGRAVGATLPHGQLVTIATDGRQVTPDGPRELPAVLTGADVDATIDRARDTGEVELARPMQLEGGPALVMAAAFYSAEARTGNAVQRRAALEGTVLGLVDMTSLLAAHLPDDAIGHLRDGSLVASTGPGGSDLPTEVIEIKDGRRLVLGAGNPDTSAVTAPTVVLAVGGVLGAVLAGGAVLLVGRSRRERQVDLERAAAQVQLIGDVAPLVQQSLDLADVLPAVAVQLSDHFGLAGIRLSSGTTSAHQLDLFSLGARPIASQPVLAPPDHLETGETLSLALQRAGRSVALLQVVAGRPLDSTDLQSLRALSELITAAVVNAALFASQQEAVRRLRDLDGLKTAFLSTASHELRTPATAIGGFASLLSASWDRFDDSQRREFASRIAANAQSLGAVVQDLLDFSLLDRGRLRVALASLDLGSVVQSVVDRLAPVLPDHIVVCDLRDAPPVAGDQNAVERIATNLLTNAAKFSPPGSKITVRVVPSGEGAALLISDEGPGVPEHEREQIFTRFYRGSGEAVVKTRGVGIGLSVVAELTDRMGGTVSIEDAPGGGAQFRVDLAPASALPKEDEVGDATPA